MSKCEKCDEYNNEKDYCPKFCDVIAHTLDERYRQGREDTINELRHYFKTHLADAKISWHGSSGERAFDKVIEQIKEQNK